ncbi:hypothetical protein C2E23DRAFT_802896 [Lenzites betulinus]|nr:hypothetical protein C2E23DRAFT_802896 [Lenzites betulinus]
MTRGMKTNAITSGAMITSAMYLCQDYVRQNVRYRGCGQSNTVRPSSQHQENTHTLSVLARWPLRTPTSRRWNRRF